MLGYDGEGRQRGGREGEEVDEENLHSIDSSHSSDADGSGSSSDSYSFSSDEYAHMDDEMVRLALKNEVKRMQRLKIAGFGMVAFFLLIFGEIAAAFWNWPKTYHWTSSSMAASNTGNSNVVLLNFDAAPAEAKSGVDDDE